MSAPCSHASATASPARPARSTAAQPVGWASAHRSSNACDDGASCAGRPTGCPRASVPTRESVHRPAWSDEDLGKRLLTGTMSAPFPGRPLGRSDRDTPISRLRLSSLFRRSSRLARFTVNPRASSAARRRVRAWSVGSESAAENATAKARGATVRRASLWARPCACRRTVRNQRTADSEPAAPRLTRSRVRPAGPTTGQRRRTRGSWRAPEGAPAGEHEHPARVPTHPPATARRRAYGDHGRGRPPARRLGPRHAPALGNHMQLGHEVSLPRAAACRFCAARPLPGLPLRRDRPPPTPDASADAGARSGARGGCAQIRHDRRPARTKLAPMSRDIRS